MSQNRVIRDETGEQIVSNETLYVDGDVPLNKQDLIIVNGVTRPIRVLYAYTDEKGKRDFWEVIL